MINNINFIGNQLKKFITSQKYCSDINMDDFPFYKEIILWGLSANKKLSKNRSLEGIEFKDSLGSFLNNI